MEMHPLLQKQIEEHLGDGWKTNPDLAKFMSVISDSYSQLGNPPSEKKTVRSERASEDKQQPTWDLLSSLQAGILVEGENNRVRFANQEFCRMFSLTDDPHVLSNLGFEELMLLLQPSLLHPDNFIAKLQDLLGGKEKKTEIEIELKNKTILELNYVPLFLNGKYEGRLWKYRNITQRKLVENTLRNISNVQRTILNGTNYSIIYTDIYGIIRSFNRGAEEMLGYTADEMIDKNTPEVFHCKNEIVERAENLSAELKRTVEPGFDVLVTMSRNGIVETKEWTFIAKGGKKLTVLQSISSIKDAHGELIGYLSIARDISEQKHAQKILALTEERYKSIVEKSSDIIYKTNRLGYFTFVNPVAEHITGYSGKELIWIRFLDLIRDDYKSKALKFYARQMKKKTPSTYFEFPIVSKSGKEIWIGQSVQYTINESNQIELIALAIDISNQKLAEKKIIESNQKLQLFHNLINNTTDAIQVTTENGKLFYINKEASDRLGIEREAAHNFHVKDIDTTFQEEGNWEKYVSELRRKGSMTLESEHVNIWTGKKFAVEVTVRYIHINGTGYLISNSRDITERKRAENLLITQEEKYRNIIANMNLGILEVDLDETIQYSNRSFRHMSGYTNRELKGKKTTDLFLSTENQHTIKEKSEKRAIGISDTYEMCFKNKNGEQKWWLISGAPNYNDEGKQIGSIGIHLDITAQKKLEQELEQAKLKAEQASKAKELFLANMSHEIRTPLNAVTGMIRELNKETLTEQQRNYVNVSYKASKHLLSIINNILDISKIEAGELDLENEHFELRHSFQNVVSMLTAKAQEKNLSLDLSISDKVAEVVVGDALRIEQILVNLVNNAIKFTSQGGVKINCELLADKGSKQEIEISVIDTGIGMEKEYLNNVFSKFSQENKSISRKFGGTGLGMAITYELVQLMEGSIEVESEKNVGSSFTVRLTLEKGRAEEIKEEVNSDITKEIVGAKVLLVEDNEMNRMVAQNALKYYGCQVMEAANGLEAIDVLNENSFDIILMDIQMPIMDGIEAVKFIRNNMKLNTPVIALSANAFKSEIELSRSVGMDDFVTKPFEEHVLVKTISKYIQLNRLKEETTPMINTNLKSTPLYCLDFLKQSSYGDESFVEKMIGLFIEQSQTTVTQIQSALSDKDYEAVSKLAHRIKPSIDNMGIVSLKDKIRRLESISKTKTDLESIPALTSEIFTTLSTVNTQLALCLPNRAA